jgi:hypothetical protein
MRLIRFYIFGVCKIHIIFVLSSRFCTLLHKCKKCNDKNAKCTMNKKTNSKFSNSKMEKSRDWDPLNNIANILKCYILWIWSIIAPLATFSCTKWCCTSMCFVLAWYIGSLASAMAPWMSHMINQGALIILAPHIIQELSQPYGFSCAMAGRHVFRLCCRRGHRGLPLATLHDTTPSPRLNA